MGKRASPAMLLGFAAAAIAAPPQPLATQRFDRNQGLILVQAFIGRKGPLTMILDTGTMGTVLDETTARSLGLELSLHAQDTGAPPYLTVAGEHAVRFAGLEIREQDILASSLASLSQLVGRHLDGIVGVQFFYEYVVEIDYQASQLRIFDPGAYVYTGPGDALAITYGHGLPIVAGTVTPCGACQPLPAKFQVDTGLSEMYVAFWRKFIAEHDLLFGAWDVQKDLATGLADTAPSKSGFLPAIRIGPLAVPSPRVSFMQSPHGDPNVFGGDFDANLGSAFLVHFRVIFDLPHERIILVPAGPPPDGARELESALQSLRDQFAAIGPMDFVVYARNSNTGNIESRNERVEFTGVRTGGPGCRLDFHEHWTAAHEVIVEGDFGFALQDLRQLAVISLAQALGEINARNGHPELGWRVVPAAYVIRVVRQNAQDDWPFPSQESAVRIATALGRVAELCRSRQPF